MNILSVILGIIIWLVGRGRVDIFFQCVIMAQFQSFPINQHLDGTSKYLCVFKELFTIKYVNPDLEGKRLFRMHWSDFCRDVEEAITPDAPDPRGKL